MSGGRTVPFLIEQQDLSINLACAQDLRALIITRVLETLYEKPTRCTGSGCGDSCIQSQQPLSA
jgi:hypothetical protein